MKRAIYIIVGFLLLLPFFGSTQQLQSIANSPSNEIYDLLVDKKGFVWVAHNLGVSRYDGISFTSFSNPEQSAISMTDLIEDNYGRIWCHNFNSQVFYIEHDKMHYLAEYNFKNEAIFPRMVLLGDELVITSSTGLFVCNTKNLKCRYVVSPLLLYYKKTFGAPGISEICAFNNKVLARGNRIMCAFGQDGQMRELKAPAFTGPDKFKRYFKLEPQSLGDTAFMIDNAESFVHGVIIRNDSVIPVLTKKVNAHVNTISIVNNKVWINTNKGSYELHGNDTLPGYNLSAITESRDGYQWFGSLDKGLLLSVKNAGWQIFQPGLLTANDYISCSVKHDDQLLLCSNLGSIFMLDKVTGTLKKIATIPLTRGSPANMEYIHDSSFFIETAKGLYILNVNTNTVRLVDSLITSKSILISQNIGYMAHSSGVSITDARRWGLSSSNPIDLARLSDSLFWAKNNINVARASRKQTRCRAVIYDSVTNTILAAFADGLFRILKDRLVPVMYKNKALYISSLARDGNKIYAGSFNNGLFLIEGDVVKRIWNAEMPEDAIVKLKSCNNHIWAFGVHYITLLNTVADTFVKDMYPLPVAVKDVTDVEEDGQNIYLSTYKGVFTLPLTKKYVPVKEDPALLYTIVNGRDTLFGNNLSLPSTKNNLLFRFAIPVYGHAGQLYFKYRLYSGTDAAGDSTWYYTREEQRDIQFNLLKHGNYTLEVIAIQDNEVISNKNLVINFSISRPWYSSWPFYILVALIIISVTIAIQQYRLKQILKVERVRRKIASDLHDDIGSTLSSINVYSEIAKKEDDNKEYITTIQQNTVSIINNLDDLVWNINPKNDVLENMIARMRQFAEPLLAEKGIECTFSVDADNLQASVTPDVRTNIYLLFKEAVNNTVKHSNSTTCAISISQRGRSLSLSVADNGKGFDSTLINKHRNGLHNMRQRAADIKAVLSINSILGQGTVVTITSQLN